MLVQSSNFLSDTSVSSPLIRKWANLWTPPERLPLSTWSERNITLSPEYAARATDLTLFSWQREIFDCFTDPNVEELILMVGTQLVKTLLMQCAIAYVVAEDPGPILMVQPKEDDAKAFVKERLHPMIRDCACLHGRISDSSHDKNSTLLSKSFAGGSLSLVGSIVPGNLARRSIRYLFCDEIDKYPASAKEEGDPISLAWERTSSYESRRKMILCCSPTVAGKSRIAKAYESSDRRKLWVPCPYCGHFQILRWSQVKDVTGESFTINGGITARYECAKLSCRTRWTDHERWNAIDKGEWQAERPGANGGKRAGFWISHLYAPWQSKKVPELVKGFLKAKHDGQEQLKVFVNTNLAELWEEKGSSTDPEQLFARREKFPLNELAVVPSRGLFLTAAVDVQEEPPRLEVELKAWGRNLEWWSLGYWVLTAYAENGEPLPNTSPELWSKLHDLLVRRWPHESGHTMGIRVMCIDTGRRPKPVYDFARRHNQLAYGPNGISLHRLPTVVPVKGTDDAEKIIAGISKENAARKRQGVRIIQVGTHRAKVEIYGNLQSARPGDNGYGHWAYQELDYYESVCAEVLVTKSNGKRVFEKRRERNEGLDLMVYNRAAAAICGIDVFTEREWQALEQVLDPRLIQSGLVVTPPVTPLVTPPSTLSGTPTPTPAVGPTPSPLASPIPPPTPRPVPSRRPRPPKVVHYSFAR